MKPVLFSVSYAGFWGQLFLDLPSFIRKAADLGYPAVELMAKRPHLSILDADEATLRALRDTAAECGVEIATIAAYTDFTNGKSAAEVPFGEMQVAYVTRCAGIAAALGAKIVRVFTGYSTGLESAQQDWNTCVRAIRECAERAAGHGVILGVQNHHDTAIAWESYLEFLNEVDHPNCKAMFDPWAPALHGDDLEACARALAPLMVQTTLADYVRLRRFNYVPSLVNYAPQPDAVRAVPLGEGFVELAPFFAGLIAGGFDGYVAYEMCSPLRGGGGEANLDDAARRSLARIRVLIG